MVSTEAPAKTCVNDGCSKPRCENRSRCLEHFRQHRHGVDVAYRERRRASKPRRIPRSEQRCLVDGCSRPVHAKELCHSHYKTHAIRKPCSIPHCPNGMHAQGLCFKHYDLAYKRKVLEITQPQGVFSPRERLHQYVQITDTCHLWTGFQSGGRGHFFVGDGVVTQAHRASFEFERGPIPTDDEDNALDLDHGCRIPLCVRPDHLEPVTSQENSRRQNVAAGRDHITQRDGWLFGIAIPAWQRGADNLPDRVVTRHPVQAAS